MIQAADLTLADIEFLQVVREINKDPDNYQETDRTDVAANTASIKRATDLTAEQVSYRMGGNQNSRGFEKGDNPLIKTYDPEPTNRGYAPRAVELTKAGWKILDETQKLGSKLEGVTQGDIDALHEKLDDKIKFLEIKSEIQDYLIMFNYEYIRYSYYEDVIIGISNEKKTSTVSKTESDAFDDYEIEHINDGNVEKKKIVDYDPMEIANTMVDFVAD